MENDMRCYKKDCDEKVTAEGGAFCEIGEYDESAGRYAEECDGTLYKCANGHTFVVT